MKDLIGYRLGQYELKSLIGQGGMAMVYKSVQPNLDRTVAIKVMQPHLASDDRMIYRFKREAQSIARLRHPHIVTVFDFGIVDDIYYMVMEYIPGGTLADVLRQNGPLALPDALRVTRQLADALDYAHRNGIIHRDVKPSNTILTDDDLQNAILTDFGIIRLLNGPDDPTIGTLAYSSPEMQSGKPAEVSSDLFSLGVVLYEMLTGHLPQADQGLLSMLVPTERLLPIDLSALYLPDTIEKMLARLLAKNPQDRFATAGEIRDLLLMIDKSRPSLSVMRSLLMDTEGQPATPIISLPRLVNGLPLTFDDSRPFLDRVNYLHRLRSEMDRQQHVIVVFGKTGIGKTALVCKFLSELLEDTDRLDGVVSLSAAHTSEGVDPINLTTIITHFQQLLPDGALTHQPNLPLFQQVTTLLNVTRDYRFVLLLDNFESVQADDYAPRDEGIAALLSAVLERGGLTVLITSQLPVRLAMAGHSSRLQYIALDEGLPPQDALVFMHSLPASDNLPADEALLPLIALTGGHPRALEAATDWLNDNPMSSLDDLLNEIRGQTGDVIHYLVGKSIGGLSPDLQRVMEGIAIFDEPILFAALDHTLRPFLDDKTTLRVRLNRLIIRRFVTFDPLKQTLALHSINGNYCRAQIPRTSDEAAYSQLALVRRAAEYFASIRPPKEQWRTYADLQPMLSEFDLRCRLGEYDTAADIVFRIDINYLFRWGYLQESIRLHMRLQGHITSPFNASVSARNIGAAYTILGRLPDARLHLDRALALAEAANSPDAKAKALGSLGIVHSQQGDVELAADYFEQTISIQRQLGNQTSVGRHLSNLGIAYAQMGHYEQAVAAFEEGLIVTEASGDQMGLAPHLLNLSNLCILTEDVGSVLAYAQRATDITQASGDIGAHINALNYLAAGLARIGHIGDALALLDQALTLAERDDLAVHRHAQYADRAWLLRQLGLHDAALANIQLAIASVQSYDKLPLEAIYRHERAYLLALGGNETAARQELGQAQAIISRNSTKDRVQQTVWTLGHMAVALRIADVSSAIAFFHRFAIDQESPFAYQLYTFYGVALVQSGDIANAEAAFAEAAQRCTAIIAKTAEHLVAGYFAGLAKAGLALVGNEAATHLQQSADHYRTARAICDAPGTLHEQRHWLDLLIRCDGGDLLRPLRALLD